MGTAAVNTGNGLISLAETAQDFKLALTVGTIVLVKRHQIHLAEGIIAFIIYFTTL